MNKHTRCDELYERQVVLRRVRTSAKTDIGRHLVECVLNVILVNKMSICEDLFNVIDGDDSNLRISQLSIIEANR